MSDEVEEWLNVEEGEGEGEGARASQSTSGDFWAFRSMLTPIVMQVLFWIGVLLCVVYGGMLIAAAGSGYGGSTGLAVLGTATILIGPLLVRIYCECIIVLFRINSTLTEIKDNLDARN
jgi:hypothetical protein